MSIGIIVAALMIGGVGLFVAIFLGSASKAFAVPVDEKEEAIKEVLPGANCGACGYAGCSALAEAIAKGKAPLTACVVGQAPVAEKIAQIMGDDEEVEVKRMVAFVRCSGNCERTTDTYEYSGTNRCSMVKYAPGRGPKSCRFGCSGFGDCVEVCNYDAISIVKGVAVVDEEKCVGCKKCMKACPKGMIISVPYGYAAHIACVNPEKGKPVMANCKVGCITCKKCEKVCPQNAISTASGYPVIDYDKCISCGKCKEACPRKCIV